MLATVYRVYAALRRYLTNMKTTVSSKGQIVLPAEFRQMDRIETGQEFEIQRLDRGDYRLVRRAAALNEGSIDWLLACPRKDFFVPIGSQSTDALSRNCRLTPPAGPGPQTSDTLDRGLPRG